MKLILIILIIYMCSVKYSVLTPKTSYYKNNNSNYYYYYY